MALKGVKVVELAGLAPGPFCGMVLADFGAAVVRVDRLNTIMPDVLHRGKKSIALNLKEKEAINIMKKLCRQSDVLIEPFRKGVMEKLGLGPKVLLQENPRLIYARLTGYGQDGYYSNRAGHDINYLATSGLLSRFVRKGQKPLAPCNVIADFGGGGLSCALGIITALYEREKSGLGQVIDSNMVEGTAYLGSWIFRGQNKLPIWTEPPGENQLDSGAFYYDTYETKDGRFMAVGALEPQFFDEFLQGLGLENSGIDQLGDSEANKKIITQKFLEKTQKEWCAIFDQTDACVTPVLNLDEAPNFQHNKDRKSFEVEGDGPIVPRPAPILERTPGVVRNERFEHAENTIEILKEIGYDDKTIEKLEDQGVIKCQLRKSKL